MMDGMVTFPAEGQKVILSRTVLNIHVKYPSISGRSSFTALRQEVFNTKLSCSHRMN